MTSIAVVLEIAAGGKIPSHAVLAGCGALRIPDQCQEVTYRHRSRSTAMDNKHSEGHSRATQGKGGGPWQALYAESWQAEMHVAAGWEPCSTNYGNDCESPSLESHPNLDDKMTRKTIRAL